MALQIQVVRAGTSREINAAFASFEGEQRPDALFVGNDAFFSSRRIQIVQLAAFRKVPAIYGDREYFHQSSMPTVLGATPNRRWSRWKRWCSGVIRKSLTPMGTSKNYSPYGSRAALA